MLTYIKQTYKIKEQKPYQFIGSKMRGLLGYALKEEVCVNPTMKCEGCFAANECLFYRMYEKANVTHDYRIDLALDEKKYKFSILLFKSDGDSAEHVQSAMLKALSFYKGGVLAKQKEKHFVPKKKKCPKVVKIVLRSPLRIKRKGRFVRDSVSVEEMLSSILRRAKDLDVKALPFDARSLETGRTVAQSMHYRELVRRSNKQRIKMNLGGLMGEMVVSDIGKEAYDLLKLGEVIGVGKATVFGLGKIKVEEIA